MDFHQFNEVLQSEFSIEITYQKSFSAPHHLSYTEKGTWSVYPLTMVHALQICYLFLYQRLI